MSEAFILREREVCKDNKSSVEDNLSRAQKYIFSCLVSKSDCFLDCHKKYDYLINRCIDWLNQLDDNFVLISDVLKGDVRHIIYKYKKRGVKL